MKNSYKIIVNSLTIYLTEKNNINSNNKNKPGATEYDE